MSADSAGVPVTGSSGTTRSRRSTRSWRRRVSESPERRAQRRRETLDCIGEVSVNPVPLLEVLRAAPDNPDAVAAAVGKCPTLTGRVLSVTNSAAFPGRRTIESIERAVIQLGASRTRAIAMAFGLRLLNEPLNLAPELARRLWVSSLRKAAASQLVCELIEPTRAGDAYCRALVQDLGLPLLVALDPEFYKNELLPGRRGDWSQQELGRFGMDHAELGSRLLQSWDAAQALVEAARDHHDLPHNLEDAESTLKLPVFFASLLPHLDEEMTGTQRDWLMTLHGQLLANTYPSPDVFIGAACRHAETLAGGNAELDLNVLHRDLSQAVAYDTVEMVSQLCRLEGALGRQRKGLNQLRYEAYTDSLTKLLNRRGFIQLAQRRAEEAADRGIGVCCLVLDLDDLKPVNDRVGHKAGDHMLRGMAKMLRRSLDRADLIGRLGGDEFAVFMVGMDRTRAEEVVQRLNQCQGTRLRVATDTEVPLHFSLGAVHVEKMSRSIQIDDLLTSADEAMYHCKHGGKGGACFTSYEPPSADDAS